MSQRKRKILLSLLCLLAAAASAACAERPADFGNLVETDFVSGTQVIPEQTSREAEAATEAALYVYVCGAVKTPGVYEVSAGARVEDAVQAAGGFTEEADREAWNLARRLSDGEQIRIPTREETEEAGGSSAWQAGASVGEPAGEDSALVNINTAGLEELMTLSGIGMSKAQAIIDYREQEGPFAAIEDVMRVSGIKEGAFQKIKDHITV